MVKYLKGPNPFASDLGGDVCIESDCEGDSPEFKGNLPGSKREKGEQIRAVFGSGSFSTCVSFGYPVLSHPALLSAKK